MLRQGTVEELNGTNWPVFKSSRKLNQKNQKKAFTSFFTVSVLFKSVFHRRGCHVIHTYDIRVIKLLYFIPFLIPSFIWLPRNNQERQRREEWKWCERNWIRMKTVKDGKNEERGSKIVLADDDDDDYFTISCLGEYPLSSLPMFSMTRLSIILHSYPLSSFYVGFTSRIITGRSFIPFLSIIHGDKFSDLQLQHDTKSNIQTFIWMEEGRRWELEKVRGLDRESKKLEERWKKKFQEVVSLLILLFRPSIQKPFFLLSLSTSSARTFRLTEKMSLSFKPKNDVFLSLLSNTLFEVGFRFQEMKFFFSILERELNKSNDAYRRRRDSLTWRKFFFPFESETFQVGNSLQQRELRKMWSRKEGISLRIMF